MKNEKLSVDNIMFEITRRCNMSCEHCLRGDAQAMDISTEVIDAVLSKIDYIQQIAFTGGEPSLKPEIMQYILQKCKEEKILVKRMVWRRSEEDKVRRTYRRNSADRGAAPREQHLHDPPWWYNPL